MPVLLAENIAPEIAVAGKRWPHARRLPKLSPHGRWWLLAVRGNFERALAAELCDRRITYYLPMRSEIVTGRGGKHLVPQPLFDGYMFAYAHEQTFYNVVMQGDPRKKIIDHTHVADGAQGALVEQLETLRKIKRAYEPVLVESYKPGRACELLAPKALAGTVTTISSARSAKDGVVLIQVPISILGAPVFEVPHTHVRLM